MHHPAMIIIKNLISMLNDYAAATNSDNDYKCLQTIVKISFIGTCSLQINESLKCKPILNQGYLKNDINKLIKVIRN